MRPFGLLACLLCWAIPCLGCGRTAHGEGWCFRDGECATTDPCLKGLCGEDHRCRFEPVDVDGDGFGAICGGGDDCDDADLTIHPGATEQCESSADEDCDGLVGCDDPDCAGGHE